MTRHVLLSLVFACFSLSDAAAQQWAAKMFTQTSYDFGAVARGAKTQFAFEFENIYEEDVHVAGVRSSCGCTTPTVSKSTLKTWEKGAVIAAYNTRSFLGPKGATLTVIFDRPYYAEVQLVINGYIRSDVVFDPGELNFGEVDQFSTAEKSVRISYAGRSDWRITDIRSASQFFEVELTETQRSGGRVAYEMLVRLKPDAPSGYFQDQLTVVSDDAQLQSIPFTIAGSVVSPLTVSPASLFLGVMEPGQTVDKQLILRGKQPFKVLHIKCDDEHFEFKSAGDEEKLLHLIPVTFKAGKSAGTISETIKIETSLGEGASACCLATGTVKGDATVP